MTRGTLLVSIDPRDVNNAHAQAQADLDVAVAQDEVATRQLERIQELQRGGKSFVLVSQDLTSIYKLSDRIMVLNQGQVIAEGGVDDIKSDPAVIEAYLGL